MADSRDSPHRDTCWSVMAAFLIPLIEQERVGWVDAPISFRTVHRRNSRGFWEPALIR